MALYYSLRELAEVARALGHVGAAVEPTARGTDYVATCGCGYRSVKRRTSQLALEAAVHHVRGVALQAMNDYPGSNVVELARLGRLAPAVPISA